MANEMIIFNMPIKIKNTVFSPCFLAFAANMIPTIEDAMQGMGANMEPNIDISINIVYIIPLLVGNSKIPAMIKAIASPTPTNNGIPTHNSAIFFFIK